MWFDRIIFKKHNNETGPDKNDGNLNLKFCCTTIIII